MVNGLDDLSKFKFKIKLKINNNVLNKNNYNKIPNKKWALDI